MRVGQGKGVEEEELWRPVWPTLPFAKDQSWMKKVSHSFDQIHQYLPCGKVNLARTESKPKSAIAPKTLKMSCSSRSHSRQHGAWT